MWAKIIFYNFFSFQSVKSYSLFVIMNGRGGPAEGRGREHHNKFRILDIDTCPVPLALPMVGFGPNQMLRAVTCEYYLDTDWIQV